MDEGTRLLVEALEVHATDIALDIGCGTGYIGMHIAHKASKGHVTMVDASLVAVDAARHMVEQSGMTNVQVLASNGTQAVKEQRFDLIATNPPFHLGGIQDHRDWRTLYPRGCAGFATARTLLSGGKSLPEV